MDDKSLIDKVKPYTDVCNMHSQMVRESLTVDEILEKYPEYLSEDQIKLLRSMSKMDVEFSKGFQEQLLTGTEIYAVDAINGVTHTTARPISEVIENMNTLNNNPMNYIVNENLPLEFTNRWYASGMIVDTGNPTEDAKRAFQNYRGPNTASTGGIREQINTTNVTAQQPLTYNDVLERVHALINQEPPQQFMDSMVFGTSRRNKVNNEPDPSIVINEETGERFKWIDGKLVNLDE